MILDVIQKRVDAFIDQVRFFRKDLVNRCCERKEDAPYGRQFLFRIDDGVGHIHMRILKNEIFHHFNMFP